MLPSQEDFITANGLRCLPSERGSTVLLMQDGMPPPGSGRVNVLLSHLRGGENLRVPLIVVVMHEDKIDVLGSTGNA